MNQNGIIHGEREVVAQRFASDMLLAGAASSLIHSPRTRASNSHSTARNAFSIFLCCANGRHSTRVPFHRCDNLGILGTLSHTMIYLLFITCAKGASAV